MRKKIIYAIIFMIAVGLGSFFLHTTKLLKNEKSKSEVTEAVTTESSEDTAQEDTAQIEQENEEEFTTEATTEVERSKEKSDELFRLCLAYIEEYELDSDNFKVKKALLVQDVSHDYVYFQCEHDDTVEYVCYTYDGEYFRDDLTQKELKAEYDQMLVTKKYDQDEFNIYYVYTDEEIKEVNSSF